MEIMQMDRYGNYYYQGSGLWRSLRDGDFEESEVWDVIREGKDRSLETSVTSPPSDQQDHRYTSAPRMVPQSSVGGGGGSSSGTQSIFANQSAPVNIPKWSNMARHLGRSKSSKACKTRPWRNGIEDDDDDDGDDKDGDEDDDDEDKDDDDDGGRCGQNLPPHEYIATRLARSKISSFSVFEGVGRKLKGRDLSRVRNDVLTKTGFLESP